MKRLFNPLWRLLTTVRVYAQTTETINQVWKDEYQPFGYERKCPVYKKNGWLVMEVCKNIK